MQKLASLIVGAAAFVLSASAAAAQYPARPIRFIVPFPPSGGVDIVARTVGEKLSLRVGQPVVVENRPGAETTIGTEIAARSTPDGYTLLLGPIGGAATAQAYYPKLGYDLRRDFAPITKIGSGTIVLVVPPSLWGELCEGADRAGESEAGTTEFRVLGYRCIDSSHRRAFQADGRRRHPARAIQRHRPAAA